MKLRKLLITAGLTLPAVIAPLGVMASCSCTQAWGNKTPFNIGSADRTNVDNPFYNFANNSTYDNLVDLDNQSITKYMQSNYAVDVANSTDYAYTTPVASRTNNDDGTFTYNDGNSAWYAVGSSFATSFKNKENKDATCYKNIALGANISFTSVIGEFINRYITSAIAYQLTQMPNSTDDYKNDSFNVAWGGKAPTEVKKNATDRTFIEWMYANSNAFATSATETMLKTVSTNFNYLDFPVPAYTYDEGTKKYSVSNYTKKLILGDEKIELGSANDKYYTSESRNEKDKITTYTYESVPVRIRAKNLTQRYINPKIKSTFHIEDFYYYKDGNTTKKVDVNKVKSNVGKAWNGMSNYVQAGTSIAPTYLGYKLSTPVEANAKSVTKVSDERIKDVKGTDFIAFVTYTYVKHDDTNQQDTVTLSKLQTVMPAYMFEIKEDLYKVPHDKSDKKIVNTSKADTYSNELYAILARTSKEGKKAHAKDLNDSSKAYLQFINYIFADKDNNYTNWMSTFTE